MKNSSGESIGVAMATYNGEKFIARQLDSILAQSLPPDKIVVVDDGSTDGTLQVLEAYTRANPTLEVYQNSNNIGYIKNFEKALGLCRTDFVALSDQDDIWHPDKLSRCVGALQQNRGAGLCYHNSGMLDDAGQHIELTLWDLSEWTFPLTKKQVREKVADRRGPLPGFSLVMHRNLVSLMLPVPGNRYCGHDWWINAIAFFLFNPVCIAEPMAFYRLHDNQVSGAAASLLKGTPYAKKKSLFDLARIRRNIKREVNRLFHRKCVLAKKRQDAFDVRNELVRCLGALAAVVQSSDLISENRRRALVDLLETERRYLLDQAGQPGR